MTMLSRLSTRKLFSAPRLVLAGRLLGFAAAALNLLQAVVCLLLLVRGDWLGLLLGLAMLLPLAAWLLSFFCGPLLTARIFLVSFLLLCVVWIVNILPRCPSSECTPHGFRLAILPALLGPPTLSLLLCAGFFYIAHRIQSRPRPPQRLSST